MRRYKSRPYGLATRPTRVLGLVMCLGVLWLLYDRVRDPSTWKVLFELKDDAVVDVQVSDRGPPAVAEAVVAGPSDVDEQELADAAQSFELVTDRTSLKPREMHAYWRLMGWSRTAPFAEQDLRALHDVAFTQLWEQPERYRGKLINLRLHVRRVLKYDAPENPLGLKQTYEAWGWTDESRSYPYVIVFPECPEGLPVGTDVRGEVVFVGYFLKVMSYTAFDTARGAPLLVGRVQVAPARLAPPPARLDPSFMLWIVGAGAVMTAAYLWLKVRHRRVIGNRSLPTETSLDLGWEPTALPTGNGDHRDEPNVMVSTRPELESVGAPDARK